VGQFWDSHVPLVHERARMLRNSSRGVAQPSSAPALGQEPPFPRVTSGTLVFKVFNNLGHLLSLE
jgi:hypothetical protein